MRYNEAFIEQLDTLYTMLTQLGEPFRARAYKKAMESIMMVPTTIEHVDQIKDLPHIGKTILSKLREYVETGSIKKIEKEKQNPVHVLTGVYGIGPKKASQLVKDHQITSIDELRKVSSSSSTSSSSLLNDIQQVGLTYYDDISKRIPREEIEAYKNYIEQTIATHFPQLEFDIVGSYRRGATTSGDIDIIMTSEPAYKDHFKACMDRFIQDKVLVELLSRGPTKSLTIARLTPDHVARRLDFMYTSKDEYSFAVLYFTGSKSFNTVMRHHALTRGYSMNEHGLYHMVQKKKTTKLTTPTFPDERSIFDFLQLEYKEPQERINGTSVCVVKSDTKQKSSITKQKNTSTTKAKKVKKTTMKKKPSPPKQTSTIMASTFQEQGVDYLHQLSEKKLVTLIKDANRLYYNSSSQPILTDNQFDIVKSYMEKHYPSNPVLNEIGAPVELHKTNLPVFMPSMNKIKPDTKALAKWIATYPSNKHSYVLSAKLDGVSGLYTNANPTKTPKLYTRGNGTVGQDISHFIPYITNSLPKLPTNNNVTIRGEFIIPKKVFQTHYAKTFANARNMVSGIINSKSIDKKKLAHVHFVTYELIEPVHRPSTQLSTLSSSPYGFEVVLHKRVKSVTNESLSTLLVEWRNKYEYEIDGVIVAYNKKTSVSERKNKNPDHAFAFKMILSDQVAEATVLDVLWAPSKDGYLKPRIKIDPIVLGGVKIEYATAFNAKYVVEHNIGIGTMIQLVRSGDVIPHIMGVTQSSEKPKLPCMPSDQYRWNDSHVDFMLVNKKQNKIVVEKNIVGFFKGLGVECLGPGNIRKIIKAGYDTIPKIIAMTTADLLTIPTFKEKMATKIYTNIHETLNTIDLPTIMHASNVFGRGFGVKKLKPILQAIPTILSSQPQQPPAPSTTSVTIDQVESIKGMAHKTSKRFVEAIPAFIAFIHETNHPYLIELITTPYSTNHHPNPTLASSSSSSSSTSTTLHPLHGKKIVLTGFRDKALVKEIESFGGIHTSSVSKNTFVVLVKDIDEDTGKAEQAREKNIPIMTAEAFRKKYL